MEPCRFETFHGTLYRSSSLNMSQTRSMGIGSRGTLQIPLLSTTTADLIQDYPQQKLSNNIGKNYLIG